MWPQWMWGQRSSRNHLASSFEGFGRYIHILSCVCINDTLVESSTCDHNRSEVKGQLWGHWPFSFEFFIWKLLLHRHTLMYFRGSWAVICGSSHTYELRMYPHTFFYFHGTWTQWYLCRVTYVTLTEVWSKVIKGHLQYDRKNQARLWFENVWKCCDLIHLIIFF